MQEIPAEQYHGQSVATSRECPPSSSHEWQQGDCAGRPDTSIGVVPSASAVPAPQEEREHKTHSTDATVRPRIIADSTINTTLLTGTAAAVGDHVGASPRPKPPSSPRLHRVPAPTSAAGKVASYRNVRCSVSSRQPNHSQIASEVEAWRLKFLALSIWRKRLLHRRKRSVIGLLHTRALECAKTV